VVKSAKWVDTTARYREISTLKMTVEMDGGQRVYGTVPAAILDALTGGVISGGVISGGVISGGDAGWSSRRLSRCRTMTRRSVSTRGRRGRRWSGRSRRDVWGSGDRIGSRSLFPGMHGPLLPASLPWRYGCANRFHEHAVRVAVGEFVEHVGGVEPHQPGRDRDRMLARQRVFARAPFVLSTRTRTREWFHDSAR